MHRVDFFPISSPESASSRRKSGPHLYSAHFWHFLVQHSCWCEEERRGEKPGRFRGGNRHVIQEMRTTLTLFDCSCIIRARNNRHKILKSSSFSWAVECLLVAHVLELSGNRQHHGGGVLESSERIIVNIMVVEFLNIFFSQPIFSSVPVL